MLCKKHRRCTILERMMFSITELPALASCSSRQAVATVVSNYAGGAGEFAAAIPTAKGDHLVCRCTGLWFYIDLFCDEHQHNGEGSRGQRTAGIRYATRRNHHRL